TERREPALHGLPNGRGDRHARRAPGGRGLAGGLGAQKPYELARKERVAPARGVDLAHDLGVAPARAPKLEEASDLLLAERTERDVSRLARELRQALHHLGTGLGRGVLTGGEHEHVRVAQPAPREPEREDRGRVRRAQVLEHDRGGPALTG